MSDNFQYLIVGALIYFGIAGIFLLFLGFNQREKGPLLQEKDPPQPGHEKDLLKP